MAQDAFGVLKDVFFKLSGVIHTAVGYMGGSVDNPTYKQVCTDTTGHAKVVQLTYNPEMIMYKELLKNFWNLHDPTQQNRQGPDIGAQYRSVIFYHTDEQKKIAEESKKELVNSKKYDGEIVTFIEPAKTFWKAEEYHQKYFEKQGGGTCRI